MLPTSIMAVTGSRIRELGGGAANGRLLIGQPAKRPRSGSGLVGSCNHSLADARPKNHLIRDERRLGLLSGECHRA